MKVNTVGWVCPHCGSPDVEVQGHSTTYCGYVPYVDNNGFVHHHDNNNNTVTFQCGSCRKVSMGNANYSCWCGWPKTTKDYT